MVKKKGKEIQEEERSEKDEKGDTSGYMLLERLEGKEDRGQNTEESVTLEAANRFQMQSLRDGGEKLLRFGRKVELSDTSILSRIQILLNYCSKNVR